MAQGLKERDEAMQSRARALAEQAIQQNQVGCAGSVPHLPIRSPGNVGSKP
jgi:hypothetical protein